MRIKTIRKWNEIDDYNAALNEITKGKKAGLKRIFDTYIVDHYMQIYSVTRKSDITKDILCRFYLDIWDRPEDFRLSNGNASAKLYLKEKLNTYLK